jgi:hypothetical protein
MKRILRYLLFGLGGVLGTRVGIWLLQRLVQEESYRRFELRGHIPSSSLPGDPTIDAPEPDEEEMEKGTGA